MLDGPAPVLEVSDLRTVFATRDGAVHAVNGVSFAIAPGELLGVVGESGSGKSVTMMSLMGLLPSPPAEVVGGSILYQGREVRAMSERELRELRGGEIGFVFQDPMTSLNPVFTVGNQLMEPLVTHMGMGRGEARIRARELLELVGLPDAGRRLDDYPHQFSGGMRQRVMIAMALSCRPKVLIADEPTTALDVTVQAQILKLMRELKSAFDTSIIMITHDMGVVAEMADRVVIMQNGRIVEQGGVSDVFHRPQAAYTQQLLAAVPKLGAHSERLATIAGAVPNPARFPGGCKFHPRCPRTRELAKNAAPAASSDLKVVFIRIAFLR